jgi:hypothetical protein
MTSQRHLAALDHLERARRWQRILDRGEARTRDDLAKLTGLGSRYGGNILELLRLHPSTLEAIERLPVGAGNDVTERLLRPIARLPHDEQLAAVAERLELGLQEDCR